MIWHAIHRSVSSIPHWRIAALHLRLAVLRLKTGLLHSVIEVLRSLGYQTQEIMKVLGKVEIQGLSESDAVKLVLKEISKGR